MNPGMREGLEGLGPGRMTALMRAASTGPKVLRVGVVRHGRMVEERIIRPRAPVTIGRSETNAFVVVDPEAPAAHRLFEFSGGSYFLSLAPAMSGRIVTPHGIEVIAPVPTVGGARPVRSEHAAAARRIEMHEGSRGKIVVGGVSFLFQFVTAPPAQPRPQLPISLVRGKGVDWRTTVIAACSFLAHFAAIGAVYSEWSDRPIDDDVVVTNVIESARPFVPVADDVETPVERGTDSAPTGVQAPVPRLNGASGGSRVSGAALSSALDRLQMSILGVLSTSGTTADVLRSGEVPTGLLDAAARRATGVGSPGLVVAGGGPLRSGVLGPGLSIVAETQGGPGGSGTASAPAGPRGTVTAEPPDVSGAPIKNAASVVASLRAGFRRCYERALATNPDSEGRIALSLEVGPGGEVQSVGAAARGNLSSEVVACVRARARTAQFDPPEGGLAFVQVPVSLVRQP